MGTVLLHHPYSSCPILNPNSSNREKLFWRKIVSRRSTRCHDARGPPWEDGGRFRFDPEEERRGDGDFGDRFGFNKGAKKRTWWADYDDYDDWEDDDDDEFWIFKVLRAFGWMVPVVGLSLLLGTGSNNVLMALAVPMAQSVLSLVIDKTWNRTGSSSRFRPKTKTRKRPFAKAATASNVRTSRAKQRESVTGSYETASRFGGWDDLDRPRGTQNVSKSSSIGKDNELPRQQNKRKLSRFVRVKEKPLFVRLMIAVFPFLGSWTRLFF